MRKAATVLQSQMELYPAALSAILSTTSFPLAVPCLPALTLCHRPWDPSQLTFKGHAHPTPDPLPLTLCLLSSAPRDIVLSVLSVLVTQLRTARAPRSSARCHLMAWARPP